MTDFKAFFRARNGYDYDWPGNVTARVQIDMIHTMADWAQFLADGLREISCEANKNA